MTKDEAEPETDYRDNDLITVADAAAEAEKCERTIRRAYRRGALEAWVDGNGRSVRIRYGDLRAWMMARSTRPAPKRIERDRVRRSSPSGPRSEGTAENLRLLAAARGQRDKSSNG
jgi:hypothetical protein